MPAEFSLKALFADANLQGYWKFNGDYADASANSYTLTPANTPTFVTAMFGQGVQTLAASSQYADLTTPTNINITGSQSWSCWIKPTGMINAGVYRFAGISDTTPTANYINLLIGDGAALKVGFQIRDLTGGTLASGTIYSSSAITNDVFYHIVGVYDSAGATLKVYINASLVGSSATSGSHSSASGRFAVGRMGQYTTDYYNGILDDLIIFNRVLTATEIQGIYLSQVKKFMGVDYTSIKKIAGVDVASIKSLGQVY